jgi:hypothetical protein
MRERDEEETQAKKEERSLRWASSHLSVARLRQRCLPARAMLPRMRLHLRRPQCLRSAQGGARLV